MKELRRYWLIRVLLYPLAFLYGGITDFRNLLYDRKILKIERFQRPVISIGNISAGGTGKTPFTMLLIDLLATQVNLAVVSRGYARQSKGLLVVSDGKGTILPVTQSGDEPAMLARRYPEIPVVVAEDRSRGIREAIRLFNPDLLLLDDAFQHRRAGRNVDIVIISGAFPLSREKMLPLGNLREKLKNLKRADLVIISGAAGVLKQEEADFLKKYYQGSVTYCRFHPGILVNAQLSVAGDLADLQDRECLGFAAIADPQQFRKTLEETGARVKIFRSFADHHQYSTSEQRHLADEARQYKISTVVTTEKDIVKLDPFLFKGIDLLALRREGNLDDRDFLLNNLRRLIDLKN